MRQVALPQFLLIDVIIDIYGLAASVSAQLFDEIPGHASSEQMSDKPVAATMGREPILQPIGPRIMQAHTLCMLLDNLLDASLDDPCSYL